MRGMHNQDNKRAGKMRKFRQWFLLAVSLKSKFCSKLMDLYGKEVN